MVGKIINISEYTFLFHDGTLLKFCYGRDHLQFTLNSAELQREEIRKEIALAYRDNVFLIAGILHVKNIAGIFDDGCSIEASTIGNLMEEYDSAEIHHLEISDNHVGLQIRWENFPPNPEKKDFSSLVIEASSIYWENDPHLIKD